MLYAVTSAGDVFRSIAVRPEWDADEVIAWLWARLDEHNPLPRLVREPAPPPYAGAEGALSVEQLNALYIEADSVLAFRRDRRKRLARGRLPAIGMRSDRRAGEH